MSDALPLSPSEYVETVETLMATKMYSLAACVMLFYDICLTFGDEVERIWKRRFTGATVLWFMNRYLTPLGYIIITASFHQNWPTSICNRYVHFPEILKTITDTAIGLIFILRLYAIYSRSRTVLFIFTSLLLAEIGVKIWSFSDGVALQLPPGLVGCILTGQSEKRFIWTFVVELIFDSCVFLATLVKALSIYRNLADNSAVLIRIVLRDGVVYFATIFAANLITVIFLLTASPDLKPINATFGNLLTSLMVSRLMLNLRVDVEQGQQVAGAHTTIVRDISARTPDIKDGFENTIIGNLGQDVLWTEEEKCDEDVQDEEAIELHERHFGMFDTRM